MYINKIAIYILFIISITTLIGCTTQNNAVEPSMSKEVSVSEFNDIPDDIKGTIIPIDSLLLYHTETKNEYDSGDSYMLWRTLQYAFGNFGVNYNRAELKDYALSCEPIAVGEFTTAILDGDFQDYPIPEKLNDDVWYDSNTDTYHFAVGDRGLSQTEITSYQYMEEHNLKVTARLFAQDDNSTICSGTFYFKRNEYASGVIEPLFYYTITDAEFTMP